MPAENLTTNLRRFGQGTKELPANTMRAMLTDPQKTASERVAEVLVSMMMPATMCRCMTPK